MKPGKKIAVVAAGLVPVVVLLLIVNPKYAAKRGYTFEKIKRGDLFNTVAASLQAPVLFIIAEDLSDFVSKIDFSNKKMITTEISENHGEEIEGMEGLKR